MKQRFSGLLLLVLLTSCSDDSAESVQRDAGNDSPTERPGIGGDDEDDADADLDSTDEDAADGNAADANGSDAGGDDTTAVSDVSDVMEDSNTGVDAASDATIGPPDVADEDSADVAVEPDVRPEDTGGTFTPLDPDLDVPAASNPPCTTPGSMGGECPSLSVCRHFSAEESRCESCEACGNLNAFCSQSSDCDILFTCFMGRCTAACDFRTPQTCGNPSDCVDVGHPTHGVCLPF